MIRNHGVLICLWVIAIVSAPRIIVAGQFVHPTHHFELSLPSRGAAQDTAEGVELNQGDTSMAVEVFPNPIKEPGKFLAEMAIPAEGMRIIKQHGPADISTPLQGAEISLEYQWGGKKSFSKAVLLNGKKRAYLFYLDSPAADASAVNTFDAMLKTFVPESSNPPTPLPLKLRLERIHSEQLGISMISPLVWPIKQIGPGHVFWQLPSPMTRIDLMLIPGRASLEALAADWEKQMVGSDGPLSKKANSKSIELGVRKCLQLDFKGDDMTGRLLVIPLSGDMSAAFSVICPDGLLPRYADIFTKMAASIQPLIKIKTPGLGKKALPGESSAGVKKLIHKSGKFELSLSAGVEEKEHTQKELILSDKSQPFVFKMIYLGFGGSKRNLQPQLDAFCNAYRKGNPGMKFGSSKSFSSADGSWTGLMINGNGKIGSIQSRVKVYMLRNILGHFVCIYQAAPESQWQQTVKILDGIVGSMAAPRDGDEK